MMSRRSLLRAAPLLIAAPAIVRMASLMPVKPWGLAALDNTIVTFWDEAGPVERASEFLEGLSQQIEWAMFYGSSVSRLEFNGARIVLSSVNGSVFPQS